WLADRDAQFAGTAPTRFHQPSTDRTTHVSGFEMKPERAAFDSIIDRPPGRAVKVRETARLGAQMRQQKLHYVHGGKREAGLDDDLISKVDGSDPGFGVNLGTFTTFWNQLAPPSQDVADARRALRAAMGLERRTDLVATEFESLLAQVKEILHGGRRIDA